MTTQGVHIHEVIESISNNTILLNRDFPVPFEHKLLDEIQAMLNQSMCFHMGEVADTPNCYLPELIKLPYRTCWFESESSKAYEKKTIFGLLCHQLNDGLYISVFNKNNAKGVSGQFVPGWMLVGVLRVTRSSDGNYRFRPTPLTARVKLNAQLQFLFASLTLLNAVNVEVQVHAPPHKINKKRTGKGKLPLFEFRTLHVRLPKKFSRGAAAPGTENQSPRVHLCRGHFKRRKTGIFWWQPHVRGDKDRGFVHKVYRADYEGKNFERAPS